MNPKSAYMQLKSATVDHFRKGGGDYDDEVTSFDGRKKGAQEHRERERKRDSTEDLRSSRDLMSPSALLNNPLNSSLDFSNSQLSGPGPSPGLPLMLASSS